MEDMCSDEDSDPMLKLTGIAKLCKVRQKQLGITEGDWIHSTRLKNRLLSDLPGLKVYSEGIDTLMKFERDIGPAVKKACDHDRDDQIHSGRELSAVHGISDIGHGLDVCFRSHELLQMAFCAHL